MDKLSGIEIGTKSTSGSTRTITLDGSYTAMDAFLVNALSGEYTAGLIMEDSVSFTAPRTVSFKLVNHAGEATSARYNVSFLFKGH